MLDRVLSYVRRHGLMRPGDRVGAAVSGGADSVALLRLLLEARAELGIVLAVVHFNHKIRGADADADQQFVADLARAHNLEFHCDADDTPAFAAAHKLSLEAAGRKLRYAFFDRLTADGTVHRVATAHTRDDQAETVLMRFLRGSGTRGLAGIYPGIGGWFAISPSGQKLDVPPGPRIIRPLLELWREELRAHLHELGQTWREDASNADLNFTRNRLRHEVLPLLRQLNPNLDQVLSATAEIAREEESWWDERTSAAQEDLWAPPPPASSGVLQPRRMLVEALLSKPLALQRRLIRMMMELPDRPLGFDHIEAVLSLATGEATRNEKAIELPDGFEAVRQGQQLWLRRRSQTAAGHAYSLGVTVPGEWEVAGRKILASRVRGAATQISNRGNYVNAVLLDPGLEKRGLCLRNWQAGDHYWPAHTREPKKLKELLQARHIPREQKPFWPVLACGDEIVWVPGFPAPEQFRHREPDSEALCLEEVLLGRTGRNET